MYVCMNNFLIFGKLISFNLKLIKINKLSNDNIFIGIIGYDTRERKSVHCHD